MISINLKTRALKRKYARLNRKIAKLRARMRRMEEERELTMDLLEHKERVYSNKEYY